MSRAFDTIALPTRSRRPRQRGLTMVLDKNLGLHGLQDLLESAAPAIDLVKLGWGTAATQDEPLVRRKCALLAHYGVKVCPGGTLTELAWLQGCVESYLLQARRLGFSCIEVSDGTVDMPHSEKLVLIEKARAAGFTVTSEVGAKQRDRDGRLGAEDRIRQAQAELHAGAWKVIVEARESGTHGVFDATGATRPELLHALVDAIGVAQLLFEAPLRAQQCELIMTLGPEVNLGNIAPGDVVGLETLRLGLRSDTLLHFHGSVQTFDSWSPRATHSAGNEARP